jgi:hypothetical protein
MRWWYVSGIQSLSQISQALFLVEIHRGGAVVTADTYEEMIGDMKDCRLVAGGAISEYVVSVSTVVAGMVLARSSRVEVDSGDV